MSTQQFFDTWNTKPCDFDGYYGNQCVDIVQQYNKDVLGGPFLSGAGAVDIWTSYPHDFYDQIPNTPDNYPQEGDIVIWNGNVGNGSGHIAIAQKGDNQTFTSFDQNWPLRSYCHFQQHDYSDVLGWLRPRVSPASTTSPLPPNYADIIRKSTLYDAFNAAGYPNIDAVLTKLKGVNDENTGLKTQIKQVNDADAALLDQYKKKLEEDSTAIDAGLKAQSDLRERDAIIQSVASALGSDTSLKGMLTAITNKRPVGRPSKPLPPQQSILDTLAAFIRNALGR